MYTTDYTPYMIAGTFIAILPFMIKLLSVEFPSTEPAPQEPAPQEPAPQEPVPQELALQEPVPQEPRRIRTHVVSDLEIVILQLLDNLGEMSTRDMLYEFCDIPDWTHVDRSDLNRCLYRMYQESIVSMRKENAKPIWSISY
jgi:hypothetical protein